MKGTKNGIFQSECYLYVCLLCHVVDFRSLGSSDRRNTLLSLAKSEPVADEPYCHFTDQRIVANGFAVRVHKGQFVSVVNSASYVLSALYYADGVLLLSAK